MDSTSQDKEKEKKKKKRRKEHEDIKMDYVPSKEGRARPFVAYFPTGYDPVAAAEDGIDGAGLAGVKWYQGADKMKARHTQLVASTHGQVDFVGLNYAGEAAAWQPCSYALGVYDKEKGTLKLVPLAGEKVPFSILLHASVILSHSNTHIANTIFTYMDIILVFKLMIVLGCTHGEVEGFS